MKRASISELKSRTSELLRAVRRGDVVRIYDRDTPIADIIPLAELSDDDQKARLVALERAGVLRLPASPLSRAFLTGLAERAARSRKDRSLPSMVDTLIEERRRSR